MKKILKTFCFILFACYANCQTLPLNSLEEPNTGGYLKDIDNVLPFWEGTWKGTINNREYTFQFDTFLHHIYSFPNGDYYYIDRLVGKFKVVDLSTNQELYNDLAVTDFDAYKIKLLSYNQYNGYSFGFFDDESHCGNIIEFKLIKNSSNLNQIEYVSFEYSDYIPALDCPYADQLDIPMFLPKVDLVLTRQ